MGRGGRRLCVCCRLTEASAMETPLGTPTLTACIACRRSIAGSNKFCRWCGVRQLFRCHHCGCLNRQQLEFCVECGCRQGVLYTALHSHSLCLVAGLALGFGLTFLSVPVARTLYFFLLLSSFGLLYDLPQRPHNQRLLQLAASLFHQLRALLTHQRRLPSPSPLPPPSPAHTNHLEDGQ